MNEGELTQHGVALRFIGTATCLVRYRGLTLLTDPNFLHRGQRVHLGYGLTSRRLTNPAMSIAELPPLDAVILSHLHGDHFDRVARRGLDHSVPVLTTKHAAFVLRRWGFDEATGMTTYEQQSLTREAARVTVTSLPGVHARGPLRRLLPPVMGSLVEFEHDGRTDLRAYITGDTVLGPHVDEIARRWPEIDVVVAHLGGTRIVKATVTMDAAQGVELLRRIRPHTAVPVHYNDYPVFKSGLEDFRQEVQRSGLAVDVVYVRHGDTVTLSGGRP